MSDITEICNDILDQCADQDHHDELLDWRTVRACLEAGSDGVGLLTLFIGVANMGIGRLCIPVIDSNTIVMHPNIPDPAHRGWRGKAAGHGKHVTDYLRGGLGIAHFDSSSLVEVCAEWDCPLELPSAPLSNFNALISREDCRDIWIDWAHDLVEDRVWQIWCIEYWLRKYWEPAQRHDNAVDPFAVHACKLTDAVLNARISNSAKGVGKRLRGLSWSYQVSEYVQYKLDRRGARAVKRARRQVQQCDRVRQLWRYVHG